MAISVKDISAASQKWADRAAGASSEFQANAVSAADKWRSNTAAAGGNWQAGVTQGGVKERYTRGVQQAGASGKFARRLSEVGSGRYSQGVSGAQQDWATGFQPYHATLSGLSLPPRRPRGDAGNYERVRAVGTALHARRLAQLGTS